MKTSIDTAQMLPRLEAGLTLLETPSSRSSALHAIVVKELVETAGETLWIDSQSNASTYALNNVAPHERTLRGLRIARAFTAFQHYALVRATVRQAGPRTDLVVVPCIAALYRDGDVPDYRRPQLLTSAASMLHELASSLDIPIVVTDPGPNDGLRDILEGFVDHTIGCTKTDMGYRFETEAFETTVYWCDGFWQTTIPYWVELLGAVEEYERASIGVEDLGQYVTA